MANEEHLAILEQGVKAWNLWREKNTDKIPNLSHVDLYKADLRGANLSKAQLFRADLTGADLIKANLSNAELNGAKLIGAELFGANLSGAILWTANFSGAKLKDADLKRAEFSYTKLQSANFEMVKVDGGTLISNCEVDENTDFSLVLGGMRIDSGTRQLLEYNIRRKHWHRWFNRGWEKKGIWKILWLPLIVFNWVLVWPFWFISDYGRSTRRIIVSFFALAIMFAGLYSWFPGWLVVNKGSEGLTEFMYPWLVVDGQVEGLTDFLHACYFSIVTMTTLGFGDIHANPASHAGQIALIVQVLLGYVMLGVLVTRIAVLFTSGGPAGKFVKMDKETKAKLNEI